MLVLSIVLMAALLTWALTPAILKLVARPPGDGVSISSYQFDLSNLRLPDTAPLEPAMLHRDMVPALDAPPSILLGADVLASVGTRSQYLVSNDAIIGVSINGKHRAYPLSLMHVHELIHDELGGTPIAVTWHWPSASPRVFDRSSDGGPLQFGVSGLVAGGGQALYLRRQDGQVGQESLLSQPLARSITGTPRSLHPMPCKLTDWSTWMASHPDTTVAGADPGLERRYKHGDPSAYYRSTGLLFDTPLPPEPCDPKEPVVVLDWPDGRRTLLLERDTETELGKAVGLVAADNPPRLELTSPPPEATVRHMLLYAAHSLGLSSSNQEE